MSILKRKKPKVHKESHSLCVGTKFIHETDSSFVYEIVEIIKEDIYISWKGYTGTGGIGVSFSKSSARNYFKKGIWINIGNIYKQE